ASTKLDVETRIPLLVDLNSIIMDPPPPGLLPVLAYAERPLVCLGTAPIDLSRRPDAIHLSRDEQIQALPPRLALLRRTLLRESERTLRAETARDFGNPVYTHSPADTSKTLRFLYIGSISPHLLAMTRGLKARGVELVSCMTLQTAENHLSHDSFRLVIVEGVLLDALAERIQALSSRLPDTPFLVIGKTENGHILDGAVVPDMDLEMALDILLERARTEPLSTRLKRVRLSATSHDPLTGLYSEAFLRAHLPRQMAACEKEETCLTVLSVKLRAPLEGTSRTDDLPRLADLLVANLRETDLVARLGPRGLLCVLRDTSFAGAVQLAGRIVEAVETLSSAQESDLADRLMWRVVERRGTHTPDGLIAAVQTGPFTRPIAA
ncbi:MAG: diguanylate cyclase, partial [Hyphomonadaceae bacterium]|nr:diguanylate cyclase [Hyphomonadaceae bacterium]